MELIKFLKEDKNSRRIFGKKELEIIEKQLNGIKLNQSERNRLSRDIRKKFEFIEKCSKFKDSFVLKKNLVNKNLVKSNLKILLNNKYSKKIQAILLFGSILNENFNKNSDIDIGVLFDNIDLREATLFRKELMANLNSKIDLQVVNILPLNIRKEIAKNHKVLYKSDKFNNLDFTFNTLKTAFDFEYDKKN